MNGLIEQAIYFALGFLSAGLLALFFLPAFWRRAARLSARRIEMQLPMTMAEIAAERDQLRAGHAVRERRIEQKNDGLSRARAADLGELGRRAARIVTLEERLGETKRDLAEVSGRHARASAELAETNANASALQKEVFDKTGDFDRTAADLRALDDEHRALNVLAEQRRAAIAGLETRISGLDLRLADAGARVDDLDKALHAKTIEAQVLAEERGLARRQEAATAQRRDALQAESGELGEKIAALKQKLAERGSAAMVAAEDAARRLLALDEALRRSRERESLALTSQERALRAARESEAGAARQLEKLRSEKAAADGALQSARDERARLHQELKALRAARAPQPRSAAAAAPTPGQPGDEALRKAVANLAADLLRHTGGKKAKAALQDKPKNAKTPSSAQISAEG